MCIFENIVKPPYIEKKNYNNKKQQQGSRAIKLTYS